MGFMSSVKGWFQARGKAESSAAEFIHVTAQLNQRIMPIDRGERYEDPLNDALQARGYGETEGGGTLMSELGEIQHVDIELRLKDDDAAVRFVAQFLEELGAPKKSKLLLHGNETLREVPFGAREGFAIYLDGVNLPDAVYETCDSNFVVSEVDRLLAGIGEIEGHWRGPEETALYVYGKSNAEMKALLSEFLSTYPLCGGARIVDLT